MSSNETASMVEHHGTRRVPYGVWVEEREGGIPSFYLAHGLDRDGLRLRAPTGALHSALQSGSPTLRAPTGALHSALQSGSPTLRARHGPRRGLPLQMRLLVENERRVMTLRGEVEDVLDDAISVRFHKLDEEHMAFIDELVAEGIGDLVED